MGSNRFITLPFVLRFLEVITSIIAFAVLVDLSRSSKYNYIMFVGISGFVIALIFMVCYALGIKFVRGKVGAAFDGLWWIFWLIAAAVATSILTVDNYSINQTRASCAFCWISWVLWTLSLIISIREVQGYEYE